MATVNEDPAMVKYLLDAGVNFQAGLIETFAYTICFAQEPCFGNFMSTTDQQPSRHDTLSQERVLIRSTTNYSGYVYWGEYPLYFAACLGQEECYRFCKL